MNQKINDDIEYLNLIFLYRREILSKEALEEILNILNDFYNTIDNNYNEDNVKIYSEFIFSSFVINFRFIPRYQFHFKKDIEHIFEKIFSHDNFFFIFQHIFKNKIYDYNFISKVLSAIKFFNPENKIKAYRYFELYNFEHEISNLTLRYPNEIKYLFEAFNEVESEGSLNQIISIHLENIIFKSSYESLDGIEETINCLKQIKDNSIKLDPRTYFHFINFIINAKDDKLSLITEMKRVYRKDDLNKFFKNKSENKKTFKQFILKNPRERSMRMTEDVNLSYKNLKQLNLISKGFIDFEFNIEYTQPTILDFSIKSQKFISKLVEEKCNIIDFILSQNLFIEKDNCFELTKEGEELLTIQFKK